MKKALALILALVMVLALAACGSSAPAASNDAPAANNDAPAADSGKTVKIGVLVSDVSGEEALGFRAYYENYIAKNYMDEIRLNTLADIAGMSPSAFSRFFKLHTGRNLSDYIIEMRLGYASRMLVDTARSIAEIRLESGFNNLRSFNRIFKKKKGCSPSEFRENYHKTRVIV